MLRQGTSKADIWIYFYSQVRHFLLLLVTLRMVPECLPIKVAEVVHRLADCLVDIGSDDEGQFLSTALGL